MSYTELRSSIKSETIQELSNPGKIYFKNPYIFINEYRKGIHVFDNSDPSQPKPVTFLNIPGNLDMAVRDNYLFADSYIDLVVVDLSNLLQTSEIHRIENVFEYYLPEYDTGYELATVDPKKGVVTGWEIKETRERINPGPIYYPVYDTWRFADGAAQMNTSHSSSSGSSGGANFGVGGSMARFGQYDQYLFVLTQNMLKSYEVQANGALERSDSVWINWGMETLFILNKTLFMGSQSGMFLYDLSHLPYIRFLSEFSHFRACDPVIADEKFAYVTLKVGGVCGSGQNVLEVINIENILSPKLEKIYQMSSPQGLGKDDELLFVCDGKAGIKIFDASQPDKDLPLITTQNVDGAYDVIPLDGLLFVVGEDGFHQYDYTHPENLVHLSDLAVQREEE